MPSYTVKNKNKFDYLSQSVFVKILSYNNIYLRQGHNYN